MKYCGVVTDRSWIKSMGEQNRCFGFNVGGIYPKDYQIRRIYSDEVPMASKEYIRIRNIIMKNAEQSLDKLRSFYK